MELKGLEFFKLDEIDREVSIWLMRNLNTMRVKSWIDYIVQDYKRRKQIDIDATKLYNEMVES